MDIDILRYDCGVCCVGSYEDRRNILLIVTMTWLDIGVDVTEKGRVRGEGETNSAASHHLEWQSTDSSKGRGRVLCKGEDSDSDSDSDSKSTIVSILRQLMQTTCS